MVTRARWLVVLAVVLAGLALGQAAAPRPEPLTEQAAAGIVCEDAAIPAVMPIR